MGSMSAMLGVALLIWAGVFVYMWFVDRRVAEVERRLAERPRLESPTSGRNGVGKPVPSGKEAANR